MAATPNADQAKAVSLAKQAMEKAPDCAKAEIASLLKGIKLPSPIDTSIILLMDTSGSMGDNNKIDNARQSATMAVQKMSATTEIALIRYDGDCNGGWGIAMDFTTDPKALAVAIARLTPGGGTPMAPAIAFAINHMKNKAQGAKRQILLLTDGQNDCGSISQAGDAVRQSQIKVDAIGFGLQQGSQAQKDLGLVVGNGGKAYSASDGRELIHAFSRAFLLDSIKPAPVAAKLGAQASALQANFDRAQGFLKSEDFDGAVREYRQALKVKPDLSEAHYNLSLTLEEQEQYLGAAEHAQKYLELEPTALDRGKVESRLAALEEL